MLLQRGPFWEMTTSTGEERLNQRCLEPQHKIQTPLPLPKIINHASVCVYLFNLIFQLSHIYASIQYG